MTHPYQNREDEKSCIPEKFYKETGGKTLAAKLSRKQIFIFQMHQN